MMMAMMAPSLPPTYIPTACMTFLDTSTPRKQAAFAGNARAMAGPTPRKRAGYPPSATIDLWVHKVVDTALG